ncbi:MAG: phosphatase PAP2 family protein [Acidimicrobiales bacterium]
MPRRRRTPAHRRAPTLRWWRELAYIVAFYSVYTVIRNTGAATNSVDEAFRHARQVVHLERVLGTFHEETIQDWFLPWEWFISFWNLFYGTAHFFVTVGVLVWLFRRQPDRYPLWRNTLAATTALALFGFAFYPLMPPRLLPASYGFLDTLDVIGGLWSFQSGPVAKVSNQYAAMPSLHAAWATWCALVVMPALGSSWRRWPMAAYPLMTVFAVVVTANHYWLDAAGGLLALGVGFVVARTMTRSQAARGRLPVRPVVAVAR